MRRGIQKSLFNEIIEIKPIYDGIIQSGIGQLEMAYCIFLEVAGLEDKVLYHESDLESAAIEKNAKIYEEEHKLYLLDKK